jgi:cell division septation protein DedD
MPAYIAPLSKSGKTLHRVRAGPVPDRAAADKLAARLKARGLPVSVVSGG